MKEEKSKNRRRIVYYLVLAVCVLLLVAATVLTVYFVTEDTNPVLEAPPEDDNVTPVVPEDPVEPNEPTVVATARFISPVDSTTYSVEYSAIYYNEVLGWYYRHKAVDFVAEEGDVVRAMADGVVETISTREETGKYIVIDHGDNIVSVYRFIEIADGLKEGSTVKQGETIGTVAAAYGIEYKDGTHLHLEMKLNDQYVNPIDYIDVILDEK